MITIRKAISSDIDSIVSIEDTYNTIAKWGKIGFLNEFKKKNSYIFVAEENKKIVGFIVLWTYHQEAEIAQIAVLKENTRRGIGTKLLNHCFEFARNMGIRTIFLEVRKDNQPAIDFYKKNSFEVYNTRKKYYDFKYDALLMKSDVLKNLLDSPS